jgi:hypothetical protein
LHIVNELCVAIAKEAAARNPELKGARVPQPYELFDVIGGSGTGAWCALLLGRYRQSIMGCMATYMEIANALTPVERKSTATGYLLDQKRLISVVESILKRANLDPYLLDRIWFDKWPPDEESQYRIRTRRVFGVGVVAEDSQSEHEKTYELLRTYRTGPGKTKYRRPGPDPNTCRTAWAVAASGAARCFLKPFKIQSTKYFDKHFPTPHSVSGLALDELYEIYGRGVKISLIVNISPGVPNQQDLEEMVPKSTMSKISAKLSSMSRGFATRGRKLEREDPTDTASNMRRSQRDVSRDSMDSETASREAEILQVGVRERLMRDYGYEQRIYHSFGPMIATKGLALNDVHRNQDWIEQVDQHVLNSDMRDLIDEAAKQYFWEPPSAA